MEPIGPLLDFLKNRPDLFVVAFILFNWYLERTERKAQQKVNAELQNKMEVLVEQTSSTLLEIKILLQVLTKGRH